MADQPDTEWSDDRRAERLARREEKRRRLRRRRWGAGAALVIAVVVVAVAVASVGGMSSHGSTSKPVSAGASSSRDKADAETSSPLVRNATPQPGWKPYTGPVPILEYHVLGAAPADAPYPELYVTRPDFHRQMDWLDEHGYEAVTLETVEDAWYRGWDAAREARGPLLR